MQKVIRTFDPFKDDQFHGLKRGVTYWENGDQKRIYYVGGPRLYCLDAKNGKPISTFGSGGSVELAKGYDREVTYSSYNSPPAIYKNLIILGSSYYSAGEPKMRAGMQRKPPPGDIVAYDIHAGKRTWIFHTIPHPGESGYDTWERLEHVPPRTRGDFRGVAGNPHQVLIQQWLPPSSPPLERGGRSETCKDSRILSHLQGLGVCISKAFNNHMNATSL